MSASWREYSQLISRAYYLSVSRCVLCIPPVSKVPEERVNRYPVIRSSFCKGTLTLLNLVRMVHFLMCVFFFFINCKVCQLNLSVTWLNNWLVSILVFFFLVAGKLAVNRFVYQIN